MSRIWRSSCQPIQSGQTRMNAFTGICATGLAFLALHQPAIAAGITYDCDTAADHFSELNLPTSGSTFTVAGKVQLTALAGSLTYTPIARIQIAETTAPGQSPKIYGGFSLSALPVDAKKSPTGTPAIQMVSYSFAGRDDEVVPLSILTKPGTIQPFTLSYDGNEITVNLGNETKRFPVKIAEPVLRIVCSTGEFLFTGVTIKP